MINYIRTKIKNQKIRLQEWREAYLFKKYSRKALIPFDENWFKGKRVAIIGGADSAYKEKLGEYIDSFDVVVRINNGVRVIDKYHEYVGKRTDFLFHSFYTEEDEGKSPIEVDLWRNKNVKNLIFSYSIEFLDYGRKYSNNFMKVTKGKYNYSCVNYKQTLENRELVYPTNPTTGIIAINTIMACHPKLIYITGITFFRTPHLSDYRDVGLHIWRENVKSGKSAHNFDIEYKAFKKLYCQHTAIFKLDTTLQQIIDNDHE